MSATVSELETSAGWSREALIENGVRLAELGFGIVRVCHPTPENGWPCSEGSGHRDKLTGTPCASPGKRPIGNGWEHTAEHDPARVRTMLSNPGNHSYGIMPPVGVFGWDVDGGAPDRLRELTAAHGPLPPTRVHRSGNGKHVFYRWPSSVPGGSGNLYGIVTRWSDKGMVVGPGSVHAGSGTLYDVEHDLAIAELPASWAKAAASWASADTAAKDDAQPGDPDWTIPDGERHPWLNKRAARLRQTGLRGAGLLAALQALNRERCEHPKPDAEIGDLARYYDGKDDDGGGIPFRFADERAATASAGIDAVDLLALELPALRMIVPDLLPEGTTALASPPKVGKSCLVYQMAVEVAIGGSVLGRRVEPGSVLYLALEDGQRRGRDRLRAALGDRTMPRGRLEVRWSAPAIGGGLEQEIETWLDAHPDAALVAIDTLQKVRQRTNGKRGMYEVDVDDLGRLQGLFRDRSVALLIVHHSRKDSGADDFLASVSGTYGITGSVDTIVVIRRKRHETFGTIVATGRDIPEAELSVRFDDMLWHEAPASLPAASFERTEVYRTIEEHGPIFPAAIADMLKLGRTSVQNMVAKLVDRGAVIRTTKGYQLPIVMSHQSSMTLADDSRRESSESSKDVSVSVSHSGPPSTPTPPPDDSSDYDPESHRSHRGYAREMDDRACQGCGQTRHPGRTCEPVGATA